MPVTTQQFARGCSRADSSQVFIFFSREHLAILLLFRASIIFPAVQTTSSLSTHSFPFKCLSSQVRREIFLISLAYKERFLAFGEMISVKCAYQLSSTEL